MLSLHAIHVQTSKSGLSHTVAEVDTYARRRLAIYSPPSSAQPFRPRLLKVLYLDRFARLH